MWRLRWFRHSLEVNAAGQARLRVTVKIIGLTSQTRDLGKVVAKLRENLK